MLEINTGYVSLAEQQTERTSVRRNKSIIAAIQLGS